MNELNFPQGNVTIYEDNQACIALANNPTPQSKAMHIEMRYHIIRRWVAANKMNLKYVSTKLQLADMLTKPLPGHVLRPRLGQLDIETISESGGS